MVKFPLKNSLILNVSRITGSAVALHCSKAHVQSQWERANFDSNSIKIPDFFLQI